VTLDTQDAVDHHFHVTGTVGKLRHDLIEENRKEDKIAFWVEKHNRYAVLMALEERQRRNGERREAVRASLFGSPDQRTLRLKQLWSRLPLYVRPMLYFLYRYVLRAGFLDGKQGFIFHFLHAYWFRLLVDINLDQTDEQCGPATTKSTSAHGEHSI
jgi:hypothetical protein